MTRKERIRRSIRLAGIADSNACMLTIIESRALNRAVLAVSDSIRASRTARRYRRADNRRAVACSLAAA